MVVLRQMHKVFWGQGMLGERSGDLCSVVLAMRVLACGVWEGGIETLCEGHPLAWISLPPPAHHSHILLPSLNCIPYPQPSRGDAREVTVPISQMR